MDFSRFRSPALDLADFLRSLAVPRAQYGASSYGSSRSRQEDEWEILRARQGGTKRLDFFDHNAAGPEGAVLVLRAMEKSPGVTELALFVGLSCLRDLRVDKLTCRSAGHTILLVTMECASSCPA